MTAAPAIMGISISFFIFLSHQSQRRDPERHLPSEDGYGAGAFIAKDR
jgi:hypothetical protein